MARGLNKVMLIGHLGHDPDTRYTPDGRAITNFNIATTESWKDKQTGERRDKTEWHRIVIFGRLAEIAKEYLHKGSLVYIEGKLQTRKWQDQTGVDRYTTEVAVDINGTMNMLDSRGSGDRSFDDADKAAQNQESPPEQKPDFSPDKPFDESEFDDDIPF